MLVLDKKLYKCTYYGSKKIELDENTSQKDLKFIMSDTKNCYKGIKEVEKKEKKEGN